MTPESGAGPDEPRTDGRAMLLPLLRDDALAGDVRLAVEAIEAEVRVELRRAVEGLRNPYDEGSTFSTMGFEKARSVVLALLSETGAE